MRELYTELTERTEVLLELPFTEEINNEANHTGPTSSKDNIIYAGSWLQGVLWALCRLPLFVVVHSLSTVAIK
jgi:hypothetical protein